MSDSNKTFKTKQLDSFPSQTTVSDQHLSYTPYSGKCVFFYENCLPSSLYFQKIATSVTRNVAVLEHWKRWGGLHSASHSVSDEIGWEEERNKDSRGGMNKTFICYQRTALPRSPRRVCDPARLPASSQEQTTTARRHHEPWASTESRDHGCMGLCLRTPS